MSLCVCVRMYVCMRVKEKGKRRRAAVWVVVVEGDRQQDLLFTLPCQPHIM